MTLTASAKNNENQTPVLLSFVIPPDIRQFVQTHI